MAPNWAQIGWLRLVAPVLMSKKFYDRLPADLQKIEDDSLLELVDYERNLYSEVDKKRLEQLMELGVEITYPDRAHFLEAAKRVYEKWADKVGGWEKINAIINFEY